MKRAEELPRGGSYMQHNNNVSEAYRNGFCEMVFGIFEHSPYTRVLESPLKDVTNRCVDYSCEAQFCFFIQPKQQVHED